MDVEEKREEEEEEKEEKKEGPKWQDGHVSSKRGTHGKRGVKSS